MGRLLITLAAVMALELGRGFASRAGAPPEVLLMGGAGLCAVGLFYRPAALGLAPDRLPLRVLGGLALAAVLLLPAAARWAGGPLPAPFFALLATVIAAGEEIAFRGAVYSELDRLFGPGAAIPGRALLFTLGHVLTHPPLFLLAVLAMGILLSLWRWACRDLVAPVIGHVIADLSL